MAEITYYGFKVPKSVQLCQLCGTTTKDAITYSTEDKIPISIYKEWIKNDNRSWTEMMQWAANGYFEALVCQKCANNLVKTYGLKERRMGQKNA